MKHVEFICLDIRINCIRAKLRIDPIHIPHLESFVFLLLHILAFDYHNTLQFNKFFFSALCLLLFDVCVCVWEYCVEIVANSRQLHALRTKNKFQMNLTVYYPHICLQIVSLHFAHLLLQIYLSRSNERRIREKEEKKKHTSCCAEM